MKYNELDIQKSRKKNRVGRGISAGQGKTAGRGTKGQKSRTGSSRKPGFEGGQNPLIARLPKLRGFRSIRPKTTTITTSSLNQFDSLVDNYKLYEARVIKHPSDPVRVVVNGDVTKKLSVRLQGASAGATTMIEKAGGSFEKTPRPRATKAESTDDNE